MEKENRKFSPKERRMRVECLMCGEADHFAKVCYYNPINMNHSWASSSKVKPNKKVGMMNRGADGSEYPSAVNRVHKSNPEKQKSKVNSSAVPRSVTADNKFNSSAAQKPKTVDRKVKPSAASRTVTADRKGKSSAASKPSAADKQQKKKKEPHHQSMSKPSPAATSTIPSVAASSSAAKAFSNPRPNMVWKAKIQQIPTPPADEKKPQTTVPNQTPNLKLKVFHYFDANGRPKTTEAWVTIRN